MIRLITRVCAVVGFAVLLTRFAPQAWTKFATINGTNWSYALLSILGFVLLTWRSRA